MRSRARARFRSGLAGLRVERLECKRLLSANPPAVGIDSALVADNAEAAAAVVAYVSKSEINGKSAGDPTERISAPLAGSSGSTLFPTGMPSPLPKAPSTSPNSAAGSTIAFAQRAPEDESSIAPPDSSTSEEAALAGTSSGGTGRAAEATDASVGVEAEANPALPPAFTLTATAAPAPTAGPLAAAFLVLQPLVSKGEASLSALGPAPATASHDVGTSAQGDSSLAIVQIGSRDGFSRGSRSQPALAIGDPAASQEIAPEPRCADLVSEFLPCDRATLERAVDRFLDQFESIAAELTRFQPSSALLTAASSAAIATLMFEAIKRRRRNEHDGEAQRTLDCQEEMTLLRSLPNCWNWGIAEL
jgi:hypothetical protein